uniref:PiggyBac transposable element-like protein n=1 Tax=Penaeus monodon majanivirus B TaxID=2984272 RepID=A0A9C7BLS8_9VIRU|nr:MAG: piggyBac transposable element-like protein [Penaeus monodon majanivirus B]
MSVANDNVDDHYGERARPRTMTHEQPFSIKEPREYFSLFFTDDLIEYIVIKMNSHTTNPNTNIDAEEFKMFISVFIYLGIEPIIATKSWRKAREKRGVLQVSDYITKDRFLQIKTALFYNDSTNVETMNEIRYIYKRITENFLKVPATPVNSVGEIMGDEPNIKLYGRASDDGFIHDILMYQDESTFEAHHTHLDDEEKKNMKVEEKIVTLLVKTLKDPKNSTVYVNSRFTSPSLVEHLRSKYGCRYQKVAYGTIYRKSNKVVFRISGIEKHKALTSIYKISSRYQYNCMEKLKCIIDLCICNAWILYNRDYVSLRAHPMSLLEFRQNISDAYISTIYKKI